MERTECLKVFPGRLKGDIPPQNVGNIQLALNFFGCGTHHGTPILVASGPLINPKIFVFPLGTCILVNTMDLITGEERERERALFEQERNRVPELFERAPMIDSEEALRQIGIEWVPSDRPSGYLKLIPQDFIVEEIATDKTIHDLGVDTLRLPEENETLQTLYVDLVKIGISTLEVKDQLASLLGVDQKHIGYAGIKDKAAITSQKISLRNLPDRKALLDIQAENFFLKNAVLGKGVMANGDLSGNRFTITVRLNKPPTATQVSEVEKTIEEIKQDGFWNFFYFQRFGTPRLLGPRLGKYLIKGEYENTVRLFVTECAARELPYFANIRKEVAPLWSDWQKIKEILDRFPYHFHLERSMINHLVKNPEDFLGALHTLPDQVRLWMYAYDCYLFNKKLSSLINEGEVPMHLPLVTSFNPKDWEPYKEYLDADGVRLPSKAYRDFPFIRVDSRNWSTLQSIDIHQVAFQNQFALFSFSLPKGSYATTFLMHLLELSSGLPILPGITKEIIDPLKVLGIGNMDSLSERFKVVMEKRNESLLQEE